MSELQEMERKIDQLQAQVTRLLETQDKRGELFEEMTPILKDVMRVSSDRLAELEEKGYFAFGKGLLDVVDHVVTGYTPQDVADLAGAVVGILDTVRALTQPSVLKLAAETSEVAAHVNDVAPVGIVGMVRASGDHDVQRGMAVMLEVLRKIGQSAEKTERRERLRAQLASRRQHAQAPRIGPAAEASPAAPRTARAAASLPEPMAVPVQPPAKPAAPAPKNVVMDGVEFTPEGFLANPDDWTRELAETLAASMGVEMTDAHWKLVEFARADFKETGASPNIRRLTKSGLSTKEIYTMFPKAPGKSTALIAGLPKPVGCI